VIFKGYTYGVGDAIVTGGRYDKLLSYFGKNAPAPSITPKEATAGKIKLATKNSCK